LVVLRPLGGEHLRPRARLARRVEGAGEHALHLVPIEQRPRGVAALIHALHLVLPAHAPAAAAPALLPALLRATGADLDPEASAPAWLRSRLSMMRSTTVR